MANQEEKSPGVFRELFASFQKNAHARLTSPFAGAFVIAWLCINWKIPAILLFSAKTIEDKIDVVDLLDHSGWQLLALPLFYATLGLVIYSFASVGFFAAWDYVTSLKSKIGQYFEGKTWTPPATYIAKKASLQEQIAYFRSLATDNSEELDSLKKESLELTTKVARLEKELASARSSQDLSQGQALATTERAMALEQQLSILRSETEKLRTTLLRAESAATAADIAKDAIRQRLASLRLEADPDPQRPYELTRRSVAHEQQFLTKLLSDLDSLN